MTNCTIPGCASGRGPDRATPADLIPRRPPTPTPIHPGAARPGVARRWPVLDAAVAKGLCAKHYMRLRRTGDAATVKPPGRKPKSGGRADRLAHCPYRAENDELWANLRQLFDENMQLRDENRALAADWDSAPQANAAMQAELAEANANFAENQRQYRQA